MASQTQIPLALNSCSQFWVCLRKGLFQVRVLLVSHKLHTHVSLLVLRLPARTKQPGPIGLRHGAAAHRCNMCTALPKMHVLRSVSRPKLTISTQLRPYSGLDTTTWLRES